MRVVGIDPGARWVGVAVAGGGTRLALPLITIDRATEPEDGVPAIVAAVGPEEVDLLIVGVPLAPDGGEDAQAAAFKAYGFKVGEALNAPVVVQDERYSNPIPDLPPPDVRKRRRKALTPQQQQERRLREHASAAAVILQRWLDANQSAQVGLP